MEAIPENPLFRVSKEEIDILREDCNLDVKRINNNLDAIEEWCKKQDHLKEALQYMDRNYLERIHLLSRGSVEATKVKIDKILTSRGLLPEITLNISVEEFENFFDTIIHIVLPDLSPRCRSRISVSQVRNLDNLVDLMYLRYVSMISDQRLQYDYSPCDRYIVDFRNINVNIITKINPINMKKAQVLAAEAYGMRVKGIHFVNTPPFAAKLCYFLKSVLKEKLSKRIHIHNSYEELHKEIPKEILPEDYGGYASSCAKIAEQWKEYLKTDKARKIIEISNKLKSDESKRSSYKFHEEYLGMPGTFRQLNMD